LLGRELESQLDGKSVVTFLIINKINDLPQAALSNILEKSDALVVVGYINDQDIEDLPRDQRLLFIKIPTSAVNLSSKSGDKYLPFSNQEFFILVSYKWELFRILFAAGVTRIIYSDLDVTWFTDVSQILDSAHARNPDVKLFIQSATTDPSNPQLCMGLVSMINCIEVSEMISQCFTEHHTRAMSGEMIGDDDVITNFYQNNLNSSWIRELPQSTFPVGMLLNLVNRSSRFPGLVSPKPAMFHANYVVGLDNKLLLLKLATSAMRGENAFLRLPVRHKIRLTGKAMRQLRRRLLSRA
jgi:Nucleotide-diphospho-sugar transferase